MTRYVVANHDWMGAIVSVLPVEEMFNIHGKRTDNVEEAVSCVAGDHAYDLGAVPIYPVH